MNAPDPRGNSLGGKEGRANLGHLPGAHRSNHEASLGEAEAERGPGDPLPEHAPDGGDAQGEVLAATSQRRHLNNKAKLTTRRAFVRTYRAVEIALYHTLGPYPSRKLPTDSAVEANISSLEVEAALLRHPAVVLAAVVARPDETWGETPCAFVQLRPGMEVSPDALIAFARDQLPHFAAPKTVVVGPLPVTATG